MTDKDAAYIAGIIDGEGCITILKQQKARCNIPAYELSIIVGMTSKSVVEWLHRTWPESWVAIPKKREGFRQQYRFFTQNIHAVELLKLIRPYIVEKQDQVELALSYLPLITGRGRTPTIAQLKRKEEIFCQLKAMHL